MNDDYIWDSTGKPDPEVERLERLLKQFRHKAPTPAFPAYEPPPKRPWAIGLMTRWAVAAVAIVLLAFGVRYGYVVTRPSWEVEPIAGTPRVGSSVIRQAGRLRVGEWLETDGSSKARISVGAIGEVQVDPDTRLQLLQARADEHRLSLQQGKLHAIIWAPPRLFYVNTPSATAIDLGCRYTLEVGPTGEGFLHVTYGWVAFEQHGRESFVPANAMCATRPGIGPGTPYFEDASQTLRDSLVQLDFELVGVRGGVSGGVPGGIPGGVTGGIPGGVQGGVAGGIEGGVEGIRRQREAALSSALAAARPRDALTLWHLLSRTEGAERNRVFDRLAQYVPPPTGVTREGILAGNRRMLDLWWDSLGLRDTSWWRMWKGPVPGR
ncbi:MAG: FecR domain-containing protein [Acidobacteria bacterium]|nr:FecR domain-containing protein [Acidobacteriota bacterium]